MKNIPSIFAFYASLSSEAFDTGAYSLTRISFCWVLRLALLGFFFFLFNIVRKRSGLCCRSGRSAVSPGCHERGRKWGPDVEGPAGTHSHRIRLSLVDFSSNQNWVSPSSCKDNFYNPMKIMKILDYLEEKLMNIFTDIFKNSER